jgi:hypothetical protein
VSGDIQVHVREMGKRQLMVKLQIEDIQTRRKVELTALIDSGCKRTYIDEGLVDYYGWTKNPLERIILVEYVDGTSVKESKIQYFITLPFLVDRK